MKIARGEVEHDRVARVVAGCGVGVELDDLRAELAAREPGEPADHAADAVRADHRARAIHLAGRGLDAHVIVMDLDRGYRAAIAELDPSCGCRLRERVIELEAPDDDAEIGFARDDLLAADPQRDRVQRHHRAVDREPERVEDPERARADRAGADLVARVALGLEHDHARRRCRRVDV